MENENSPYDRLSTCLFRDLRIFAWRKFEPRREKLKIGGMIYDLLILEQLFENVDLSSWKKGKG